MCEENELNARPHDYESSNVPCTNSVSVVLKMQIAAFCNKIRLQFLIIFTSRNFTLSGFQKINSKGTVVINDLLTASEATSLTYPLKIKYITNTQERKK